MKNIILKVLDKYSDTKLNIASESARDILAEDIRAALVMNGYADCSGETRVKFAEGPVRDKNGKIISVGHAYERQFQIDDDIKNQIWNQTH
jgi:hypothetical protein